MFKQTLAVFLFVCYFPDEIAFSSILRNELKRFASGFPPRAPYQLMADHFCFLFFFYDTINQRSYWESLPIISCTKDLVSWFRSYLVERTQNCSVKGALSEASVLSCTVPQGTTIGPIAIPLIYRWSGKLPQFSIWGNFVHARHNKHLC